MRQPTTYKDSGHATMAVAVWLIAASCMSAPIDRLWAGTVTLNGYTFSTDVVASPDIQDSALMASNPFFSDYPRLVDLFFGLYGYGSFAGKDNTLSYRQTFPVNGVQCSVLMEQGWVPFFSSLDGGTSFTFVFCTNYYYLARDIDNNVHILLLVIYLDAPENRTMSWSVDDLPMGGTTLLYPADPVKGQKVFGGRVEETSAEIDGITDSSMVILYDELPFDFPGAYREYLVPGKGIYCQAYNWDGAVNGFSQDGMRPDRSDDDKAWGSWGEDHCFISACRI